MIRAADRRTAARLPRSRPRRRPSPSPAAPSRWATARSRSRAAPSSSATGGSRRPALNVGIPQGAQMIDARGKWVTPGHRRRLLAARPFRGRSWRRRDDRRQGQRRPVRRSDRRRSGGQSEQLDHRRQPRRRRHARHRRAECREEHLRGAGRGHRPRRRHGADHSRAAVPVRRARRDRRGHGRRLARVGLRPVPQCAAGSVGASPLRAVHFVGRVSRPRTTRPPDRPQPERIRANMGPTPGAARTCC